MVLLRFALAAAAAHAAAPTPEDYRIPQLPGEEGDESTRGFKQYAGHMPLGDAGGTELFFWFVESAGDPAKDPVVFWTNGGPGSSSVAYGFWTEHGPFRPGADGSKPVTYDYSWNKIANVIYLENPTGVGYSFSRDTSLYENITDDLAAEQSHAFLGRFFEVFSGFASNPFFVTGESYGGHYVPNLAEKLLDDGLGLDMRGFLIGNPGIQSDWYYNVDEYAFVTYMWSHGLIPAPDYLAAYDACGWKDFFSNCTGDFTHPSASCKRATDAAVKLIPNGLDLYNVLAPTCHAKSRVAHSPFLLHLREKFGVEPPFDPCLSDYGFKYMHRPEVAEAIHAKVDPKRQWPRNPANWYYNEGPEGSKKDISVLFPKFFERAPHWKIWVVSGDADAAVPFLGTQRWMECLGRDLVQAQEPWMLEGEVAGTLRSWDKITLLLVKGCGHTIPTYCPKAGYKFFEDYLADTAPEQVV